MCEISDYSPVITLNWFTVFTCMDEDVYIGTCVFVPPSVSKRLEYLENYLSYDDNVLQRTCETYMSKL